MNLADHIRIPYNTGMHATRFPVAVLAGGRSSRFGTDKAFCVLEGRPLIEHVLDLCSVLSLETLLVSKHPDQYRGLPVTAVADGAEDYSPVRGIIRALEHFQQKGYRSSVLVLSCDTLWEPDDLLLRIASITSDAVFPIVDGYLQPFPGKFPISALGLFRSCLQENRLRMSDIIAQIPHVKYPADTYTLWNINTRTDLYEAEDERKNLL